MKQLKRKIYGSSLNEERVRENDGCWKSKWLETETEQKLISNEKKKEFKLFGGKNDLSAINVQRRRREKMILQEANGGNRMCEKIEVIEELQLEI